MAKPVDALDYVSKPGKYPVASVCVLFADEAFLKRQALWLLRQEVLPAADAEFSLATFNGPDTILRDVLDELSTVAMFGGGRRLVVVEDADDFVSRHRAELEDYVQHPKTNGVLVLDVKTWSSSTRLYKALCETGLQIECRFPSPARLLKWIGQWASERHQAQLEPGAAELLAELVEPDLGLFDQQLARLALLAGVGGTITTAMVQETVATWRTKTAWDMLDAAAAGAAPAALLQLDRLLLAGEAPIALLAQMSGTLRRYAAAARLVAHAETAGRRTSLRAALEEAGVKPFVLAKAEAQLRQLGRGRATRLLGWLLEADLALKGISSAPARARLVLEQLIARLSRAAAASAENASRATSSGQHSRAATR